MVETAMREAGVEANATLMIGDTTYDIVMGRNAGVATIGVTWGYHDTDRLAAVGAHAIIADFAALEAELDRLLPKRKVPAP
jgi:phosphoglycolate phosphatase